MTQTDCRVFQREKRDKTIRDFSFWYCIQRFSTLREKCLASLKERSPRLSDWRIYLRSGDNAGVTKSTVTIFYIKQCNTTLHNKILRSKLTSITSTYYFTLLIKRLRIRQKLTTWSYWKIRPLKLSTLLFSWSQERQELLEGWCNEGWELFSW